MKINYKIVWLDDQPKSMEKYIDEIKSILADNFFIADIKDPYESYEDFHHSFEFSSGDDVYGEVFNDCDLLLIDYNIAETQENEQKTGATLISELRSKGIYTETIFYSNAMDEYRKSKDKKELDNVIYADKTELLGKVESVIKRTVVQSMIISNLRGYLMDCTSDFDFICRSSSEFYFQQLKNEDQLEILQFAEKCINDQYKNEYKKFVSINKKYSCGTCKKIDDISSYNEIPEGIERIKLLRKIFNSQESLIVTRDKFRLLALILKKNNIKTYSNIYSVSEDKTEKSYKEKDIYSNAIITHRNKLAHNKLKYGEKCKNRIKIIRILDDLICGCDNNECDKSYSYDDCKELRKNIYNYYLLFNELLEAITIPEPRN